MRRKYEIKVDRSGRGRSFTIVNKETGVVVGTAGVAKPGAPVVSAATIRKKEPPKPFVLPKPVVAQEDDEDTDQEGSPTVVDPEAARQQRMANSINSTLRKKRGT
jgi:hypothetical protein